MTLTPLRFANFTGFADSHCVPLRPITLVYWADSLAKPSILHALAIARHAVEAPGIERLSMRIRGKLIDRPQPGGFGPWLALERLAKVPSEGWQSRE